VGANDYLRFATASPLGSVAAKLRLDLSRLIVPRVITSV
jgi:hypothetical protein